MAMHPFQARLLQERFAQQRFQQLLQQRLLQQQVFREQLLEEQLFQEGLVQSQREREAEFWRKRQQAATEAKKNEHEKEAAQQYVRNSADRLRENSRWMGKASEDEKEEDDRSQYPSDSPPRYKESNVDPASMPRSPSLTIHHCKTCYNQHLDQGILDSWNEEDLGAEAAGQLAKDRENLKDVDKMVQSQHKKSQACRVTICFCGNLHLCPGWDECRTEQHRI